MDIAIVIGLLVLAMVFFIIEAFFIPGLSIAGITGGLLTVGAVWYAYTHIGITAGHITLIGSVLLIGFSIWWFVKSKTLDRMSLKTNVDGKVESVDADRVKVGDKGITISRLAPMGKVKINGNTLEAKTADGFIDENVEIIVKEMYRTNVLVEKANI
ncbi:MAG: NfeD family protein [Paludibacteraceae bacterium]